MRFKTQKKKRKSSSNPRKEKTNSSDTETHTSDDSNEAGRRSVSQSVSQSHDVKKTNLKTLTLSGASVFFPKSRKYLAGLPRKKEFAKKLTTKKCNKKRNKTQARVTCERQLTNPPVVIRVERMAFSDPDPAWSTNVLCPPIPSSLPTPRSSQSKFARWRVRSRRSVQSRLARCQVRRLRSSDIELSNSQSLQDIWTRSAFFRFFFLNFSALP